MSRSLTAEEILSTDDRKVERVACPEWGGHVHVRSLSGEELDAWEVEQFERSRIEKEEGNPCGKQPPWQRVVSRLAPT